MARTIKYSEIRQWAKDVEQKVLLAIWRGSLDELARDLTQTRTRGGRVPIKHGNLYRSFLLSTTGAITRGGTVFPAGPTVDVALVKLEDTVYLGYQAAHAHRQNYGFVGTDTLGRTYNQSGAGFLESGIANWPAIVAAETAYVRGKIGKG